MKKKSLILTFALIACCAAGTAACSKDKPTTEEQKYTITFYVGGGEDDISYELRAGDGIEEPATPTREYYRFEGWYVDSALTIPYEFGVMPEGNVSVYGKWTPQRRVRFYFDANGGAFANTEREILTFDVGEETAATENEPTKYGYKFDGWCVDVAGKTAYAFGEAPEEDVTLYAKWKKDQSSFYYATFTVEGEELAEVPVAHGDTLTAYKFEKGGLIVSEWYTEENTAFDFSAALTGNVQLTGYPYTKGLKFSGDTVTGYSGEEEEIVVPSRYNGKDIVKIGENAFKGQSIVKATLPETVATIGAHAFADCTYLKDVVMPAEISEIGAYAFYRNLRLQSEISLTGVKKVRESAFNSCEKLTVVNFGNKIDEIGAYAFAGCAALREVTLPATVVSIGERAFTGCAALTTFTLPEALTTLGAGALTECANLHEVKVAQGNGNFTATSDCLYTDGGKTLILYFDGEATAFSTATGTEKIADGAFSCADKLTALTVGDGVTTIENGALRGAKKLQTLTLPFLGGTAETESGYLSYAFGAESATFNGETGKFTPASLRKVTLTKALTAVPAYAFYGCTGLKEVEGIGGATSYGYMSFAYTGFETFEIPATVQSMGLSDTDNEITVYNVFGGCKALTEFTVASGNSNFTAKEGCLYTKDGKTLIAVPAGKTEVAIDAAATKIETYAFFDGAITKITVPNTVETIAYAAFYRCSQISEMTVPFIGGSATENRYMLYVFGGRASITASGVSYAGVSGVPALLRKVVYTGEAKDLPDDAFAYCRGLKEVTYPATVQSIGARAFYKTGMESLQLGAGVKSVGTYAFAEAKLSGEVLVPATIESIGAYAFAYNQSVTKAAFAEGIKEIPEGAFFAYRTTSGSKYVYYSSLTEIEIPASVETIGAGAFYYAGSNYYYEQEAGQQSSAVVLTFAAGSRLQTIGESAFCGSGVKKLALPATVKTVDAMAFFACDLLEEAIVGTAEGGSAAEKFGTAAFGACEALTKFVLYKNVTSAAEVPTMDTQISTGTTVYEWGLFYGADETLLTIEVRGASWYAAAAGWSDYAENIREIEND